MTAPGPPPEEDLSRIRALLAHLGTAMIATGQPVHEVADELTEVSRHLGYPGIQIGAGPTSITVALSSGSPATFESVSGTLRLDQAADVRRLRHQLLTDDITTLAAVDELIALPDKPARYPCWLSSVGFVTIASGIALILQPGRANVAVAAACAAIVLLLARLAQHSRLLTTLLPTVAAFVVSAVVFSAANAGLLEGPLRTILPPLAVLLPGALLVTGLSELAAGEMQAGSSRVLYGAVQLGLFALGLVAASTLLGVSSAMLRNVRVDQLGWWAAPVGLAIIALGICLLESIQLQLLPWILVVLVLAFAAQSAGQQLGPAGLGSFLGAVAASLGASLVEAVRPQLARLVVFLPAFWLLVPGSLGLVGVTQVAVDRGQALDLVVGVFVVICAIASGLLVGSATARSIGELIRRSRHPSKRRG